MLEDSHGRSILFHGMNAVYKVAPYIPTRDKFDPTLSMTDEDI
jgi:endoglycosylceramidase